MTDEIDDNDGQDFEKQAREMGWSPKEKFRGDPDKWVDAKEYVERGENVMPILKANNSRLKAELLKRDGEIGTLKAQLETVQGTLDRLDAHYSAANQRAAEQAINGLKEQLRAAREDQDIDKEVELLKQIGLAQDEVTRLSNEDKERKDKKDKAPEPKKSDTDPELAPEIIDWQKENDWFGTDAKKTKQFNRIAQDLREELNESGEELTPVEFLDRCSELWETAHGESTPRHSKTDTGSRSSSSATRGGKTSYDSLPKEAKEACMADADFLVGEGKRFKTLADWQKEYARIYHS